MLILPFHRLLSRMAAASIAVGSACFRLREKSGPIGAYPALKARDPVPRFTMCAEPHRFDKLFS